MPTLDKDGNPVSHQTWDDKFGKAPRGPQTIGEYRVGLSFNPSGNPKVDEIKRAAAALIDAIDNLPYPRDSEVARLVALGMTHAEDAAMWGVKAATKPERE